MSLSPWRVKQGPQQGRDWRRALARQQVEQDYTMNGCLYLIGWEHFRHTGAIYSAPESTYGLRMEREWSIEIDEPVDLDWARFLAASGRLDLSEWIDVPRESQAQVAA